MLKWRFVSDEVERGTRQLDEVLDREALFSEKASTKKGSKLFDVVEPAASAF